MVKIERTYSIIFILAAILALPLMIIDVILKICKINVFIIDIFIITALFIILPGLILHIIVTRPSGKEYMEKYPTSPNFNENQLHHALILLISQESDFTLPVGLSVLIKALLKKNCNFKLYYCHNCDEVKNVLKNQYASDIWIFGHGWRGGLGFKNKQTLIEWIYHKNEGESLEYNRINENINEYPKKRFIAQLHCNHKKLKRCNIPLPKILLSDSSDYRNSFVSSFCMDPLSIYLALRFRLQKRIKNTS